MAEPFEQNRVLMRIQVAFVTASVRHVAKVTKGKMDLETMKTIKCESKCEK